MDKIRQYRRQLSYLLMLAILLSAICIVLLKADFIDTWINAIIHTLLVVILILAYRHARRMYLNIKDLYMRYIESSSLDNVTIEQVIDQRQEASQKKIEQSELKYKTLIEQFDRIDNPAEIAKTFLAVMSKEFDIVQGLFYQYNTETETFNPIADYAYYGEEEPQPFKIGEGLNGQVARDKKEIYLNELPASYRQVVSGLGKREPKYMLILPIISGNKTVAVVELSFFSNLATTQVAMLHKILNNLSSHFEK